ncbi:hypothetical protein GBA52_010352 [Prunus armeniaca]|nr:hypothetical protein GBA52_010352 [Prunus armeniaca]
MQSLSAHTAQAATQLDPHHPSKPPILGCDATIVKEKNIEKRTRLKPPATVACDLSLQQLQKQCHDDNLPTEVSRS